MAFARDKDNNITGYQKILLDINTNSKADTKNPKKSYGNIKVSFVSIHKTSSDITIIAGNLETALSIKKSGIDTDITAIIISNSSFNKKTTKIDTFLKEHNQIINIINPSNISKQLSITHEHELHLQRKTHSLHL